VIIVDTSVWIDYLHKGEAGMASLLDEGLVLMHPFVLGEISLGSLRDWHETMRTLSKIPQVVRADDNEVVAMIASKKLQGSGIGFVDAHLVASALLTDDTFIWTRDRRLAAVACRVGVDAETA
jgi:predicted nucleic acid-binding protein